ncbi:MAG: response regulator [Lachnospiraceae bacterium]|nr:response regulator [Candidatus Merdinaster equi]
MNNSMNQSSKEAKQANKNRHEAFRSYYWKKQCDTIFAMSIVFFVFCVSFFFFVVPMEHSKFPDLGRWKYGIASVGHIVSAAFSKWLVLTKRIPDKKKAVVSEIFTFILGLIYLLWGIFSMEVAIIEYGNPVILMYLILMAAITAFLYFPLRYFVAVVAISYSCATVCFVMHIPNVKMDATTSICAVVMMILFGVLCNTRYKYGRDRYEFEAQNRKLIEEKEAQNEELEAQNEELIAINQELNETTEKLTRALDDLERNTEAQKNFTNSMNHELRAPLNGIIGTLQVMLMNDKLAESDRHYLEQCMSMSKSLLSIVNDLLDIAKMGAGEFEIFPAAFDLHEVISNIEGIFTNQAESKGLKLNIVIPDDMVCGLYGDDFRIQQILTNIVSNGIKYTAEGSVTVDVSFENDTLKFVISDTGQGMSIESMKYLFVPFKRIAEAKNKKIQGTGLGMSIVLNLLKQMQGTIDVDSELGKGTTFTVLIPSKITDANNTWGSSVKHEAGDKAEGDINLAGKSILYVDDTKLNLMLIKKLLADTGVNVVTTTVPSEGLGLAQKNKYDIIMTDHQMPEMSGPELLEAIREKAEINSDTPVVILTGNAGAGTEERYRKMGFTGYLCKPVLRDKLLELIKKTI